MVNSNRNFPSIIIVDDVQRLVNVYEKFFRIAGLTVLRTFNRGEDLLSFFTVSNTAHVSRTEADSSIVLLDHRMPGLDGIETAVKLKELNPRPKIILVTGELGFENSCRDEVFDATLQKPFSLDDLLKTIGRIISPLHDLKGSKLFDDFDEIRDLSANVLSDNLSRLQICLDATTPLHFFSITNSYLSRAIAKGLRISVVTEITPGNFQLWKKMISDLGIEVRHADGIRMNFLVADQKHYVTLIASDQTAPRKVIYSNVDSVISYNRYLFDSLCRRSRAAKNRIDEIESAAMTKTGIELVKGDDDCMRNRINLVNAAIWTIDVCYESDFASQLQSKDLGEAYRLAISRGVRIRHITEIGSENLVIVKKLIHMGVEVRHLKEIKGGFAVTESNVIGTAAYRDSPNQETLSLRNNYPISVQHFQWIFNSLWEFAIPADLVLKENIGKSPMESSTA